MSRKSDKEEIIGVIAAGIRESLGVDGYNALVNQCNYQTVVALLGKPGFAPPSDPSESALEEWPVDMAIHKIAQAEFDGGPVYDSDELPGAILKAYERLQQQANRHAPQEHGVG